MRMLKPRCGLCEELIFSGSYIRALNSEWHLNHFSCWHCDVSLNGKRYVLTDDHPCCISCYEENFTNRCRVCTNKIGLDSRDISYKDQHWHESCFTCFRCSLSLLEKAFAVKHEKSYCEVCYDREFSSRCESCEEVFQPGTRKIQYKSKQWHDSCFHCKVCKTKVEEIDGRTSSVGIAKDVLIIKVGSKSFIIPNDKDIYCVRCFEDKIATKCTKCKNILTTGGVTFRNEPWHKECFVCVHCNGQLAGQKFASREDKPYCAVCFGELFAKRCASCSQPITGQGGTRFISFEGRHWHSMCFICALCQKSMAGKGFITDGEDIICPDCAKDKLMGPG
ncbi:four and a half LIM domains protein 2 isoform X1 [Eurytemora carolleeae]|uniref:four and a half LIM domains protein 2 isoform X1 n=1 Tax=Eurytemora carolleeae TaxID=1294199 RepID=UPI000C777EEF|nr:four and a half LIM domains protein 2 isoform X1 [Eurytemora carolleeae]|eukprot:XP_023340850.1 four and a half LIM domains protein 2-like isoform X1 [Eurytemora affinis]